MSYYYPLKQLNKDVRKRTIGNLLKLRKQLDDEIPQKTATNTFLLATWNLREFGDNRTKESLFYIAEIISHFDLVAVQEVSSNLKGLEDLKKLLDWNWDYIVTTPTAGRTGGGERMAFLYDKSKILFEKIAGEVVLPQNNLIEGLQFARTPYSVSFQANWFKFVLTTVHIIYGKPEDKAKREKEINAITSFLSKQAKKENTSYVLLGDFNIPNEDDVTMKALERYGFSVPAAIKEHPSDLGGTSHYDQIAFNLKLNDNMVIFSPENQKAGAFNFIETVYREEDLETYKEYFHDKIEGMTEEKIRNHYLTSWRTFQMSDHLPLWVELKIDFSDGYLEKLKAETV